MTLEKKIPAVFAMSDAVWQRHANPWSGLTRFTALPLLILAFWSRVWLSWWALVPVGLALLWTWLNPRLFRKPASTRHWISKGVLGERVWSNRNEIPVPKHHRRVPNILSAISAISGIFVIWGVRCSRSGQRYSASPSFISASCGSLIEWSGCTRI